MAFDGHGQIICAYCSRRQCAPSCPLAGVTSKVQQNAAWLARPTPPPATTEEKTHNLRRFLDRFKHLERPGADQFTNLTVRLRCIQALEAQAGTLTRLVQSYKPNDVGASRALTRFLRLELDELTLPEALVLNNAFQTQCRPDQFTAEQRVQLQAVFEVISVTVLLKQREAPVHASQGFGGPAAHFDFMMDDDSEDEDEDEVEYDSEFHQALQRYNARRGTHMQVAEVRGHHKKRCSGCDADFSYERLYFTDAVKPWGADKFCVQCMRDEVDR
mmetsp:Transcript_7040/g.15609  ORF Transcript_7040/g.15609 Transcript_7040/m.15609 type:complete len:273 (-) Transcript_7040:36-854(-)